MKRKPYPSDLTDEEWTLLKELIPPAKPGGRPRKRRSATLRLEDDAWMNRVRHAVWYRRVGDDQLRGDDHVVYLLRRFWSRKTVAHRYGRCEWTGDRGGSAENAIRAQRQARRQPGGRPEVWRRPALRLHHGPNISRVDHPIGD